MTHAGFVVIATRSTSDRLGINVAVRFTAAATKLGFFLVRGEEKALLHLSMYNHCLDGTTPDGDSVNIWRERPCH